VTEQPTISLITSVAERFAALSDPTRLSLLLALVNEGEHSVGQLAARLGLGQANVSKHLTVLHRATFLSRRQAGTTVYYAVADPSLLPLYDLMSERVRAQFEAWARGIDSKQDDNQGGD